MARKMFKLRETPAEPWPGSDRRKVPHFVLDVAVGAAEGRRVPRKLRVEYPGAMYHVMSRGDQRDDIFFTDVDRHDFIKTLAEACEKTKFLNGTPPETSQAQLEI